MAEDTPPATMRKFVTPTPETPIEVEEIRFDVDGVVMTATEPGEALYGQLYAGTGRMASEADRLYVFFRVLDECVDPAGRSVLHQRLTDSTDPFDVTQLGEIVNYLLEEFSTRRTAKGNRAERRRAGHKTRPVIDGEVITEDPGSS